MNKEPGNEEILKNLVHMKMPFGKYKGLVIIDLPEYYLAWFARKGFPQGKLGELMALAYEIKLNGLTHILNPIRSSKNGPAK